MKKTELMKQYEELKGKGKEPEMIFLYIHMPTGETETIVNPNVEEKMKYIDRTYNEDLVHANCKDIYIEEACICADFGPSMMFSDAYMLMKQGVKVKLPNWGGYWYWDAEKKTIMIHTKDGEELDIRQTDRPEYTFDNIANGRLQTKRIAQNSAERLCLDSGMRTNFWSVASRWQEKAGTEKEFTLKCSFRMNTAKWLSSMYISSLPGL